MSRAYIRRTSVSAQLLHDLRTPLNQIIGYSEMLSEDASPQTSDTLASDLDRIRVAGKDMLAIIEANFAAGAGTVENREVANAGGPERANVMVRGGIEIAPGRLLVVDDEAFNRDVLSRRLRRQGHVVRTADNGREALTLLSESAFDVVLLDIMMPDMDGYDVLGRIKADARLQDVPVIMISALSEVQSVVRCIEAGAEDYLTKPFDPILLKARIGACLEKKRGRDREVILFEELQRNFRRLQELERLRDDMRNMIVHDLRTPLTGVIVGVEMLEHYGPLTSMQREMTQIAVTGGKTLLGMINDLLDIEKLESDTTQLRYEPLSAAQLIAGAVQQIVPLANIAGTTVVIDAADDLQPLDGDAGKLSRTLVNLIANAIRFTRGGTVTVRASCDADDMTFSVADNGSGIPSEAFERIFEKFGQVDPSTNIGTGLGLAFCKLAVEAHHGTISVESTAGVGSVFTFTIPLSAAVATLRTD